MNYLEWVNRHLHKNIDSTSELRKDEMTSQLFNEVFRFQPSIFGWSNDDLKQYQSKLKKIKEAEVKSEKMKLDKSSLELVLREKGKYFDTVIKNDPLFEHLREIYSIIFEDSLFLVEN